MMRTGKKHTWAAIYDRFKARFAITPVVGEPKNRGHSMDVLLKAQVDGSKKLDEGASRHIAAGIQLRLPPKSQ
jgi:hypothetical protein